MRLGLTNPALAALMQVHGVPKGPKIYADSSEPKSIQELRGLGYRQVMPAEKGPDSVLFGVKQIAAMENYATENNKNLRIENEEYKWQLDSNGESTDKPEISSITSKTVAGMA